MRFTEFIKTNKIEEDEMEEIALPERVFLSDLKYGGWKLAEAKQLHELHQDFNELNVICINPNFYYDGRCIAEGRSFKILASGEVRLSYADKAYTNMYNLFQDHGIEVLQNWNDIEWYETMGWIVVSKKHGGFYGEFDEWDECPRHKDVKL